MLVARCLLHLWSRCLLAHLKLIRDTQMIAALLDCHLHHPGEYRCCCWQSSHRDGGWCTEPAPFLPPGTAGGDPAFRGAGSCLACRQRHQHSLVSNARREQECHTHRLCLPMYSPFPCSRCFRELLHVQSAPFGTADKTLFWFTTLCACMLMHTFQYFYSKIAGLPARRGQSRALHVGWGKRRHLILFRHHLCFAGRDRGKGSDSLADE